MEEETIVEVPGRRRRRRPTARMVAALFLAVVALFVEGAASVVAYSWGWDHDLVAPFVGAAFSAACIALLGGARALVPTRAAWDEAWGLCWFPLLVSFAIAVGSVAGALADGEAFAPGWQARVASLLVLCLGIGLSEELVFRGLVFGGFLERLGAGRGGVLAAAALSAVVFGSAHIAWGDLDWSDPLQPVQAALKVCQAGLLGFALAAAAARSGGLAGVAAIHALDDFLLLFASTVLVGDPVSTEYVAVESAEAFEMIYSYAFACLLYLPPAIYAARALRRAETPARLLGGRVSDV